MSRTSVKSRLASRLPTLRTGAFLPFSMSAICLAKSLATNTGPRRGPPWLDPARAPVVRLPGNRVLVAERFLGDLPPGVGRGRGERFVQDMPGYQYWMS